LRADGKTNAQTDTITLTFGDLPSSLSYFNATDFTVTGASLDSIGPLSIYGGSIINGSLQGGTIELSVSSVTGAVGVTFAKQYYANKTASAAGVSTGAITIQNVEQTGGTSGSNNSTGITITLGMQINVDAIVYTDISVTLDTGGTANITSITSNGDSDTIVVEVDDVGSDTTMTEVSINGGTSGYTFTSLTGGSADIFGGH
jgi:hypothetical protein